MKTLTLSPDARARLERHLCATFPLEGCGLLVGTISDDGWTAEESVPVNNMEVVRPNDRYVLDPAVFVRVDSRARDAGKAVVGIYHSHPNHPAHPSTTDTTLAWPDMAYVIVALEAEAGKSTPRVADLRTWVKVGDQMIAAETA